MLSYLHTFHAGNRADVVKHAALDAALRALRLQARPLHFLDTHAGRGLYDLGGAEARKTKEADSGVLALLAQKKRPLCLAPYLDLVRRFNPLRKLQTYPGSPAIAAARLRPQDRLTLCEMHPREIQALRENFAADQRADVKNADGWTTLRSGLRAVSDRRLIVLVDPSYETASDYAAAADLSVNVRRAPRKAILMLWTPILGDARQEPVLRAAHQSGAYVCEVRWPPPEAGRVGLLGSALALFGADTRLKRAIEQTLGAVAPMIGGELSIRSPALPEDGPQD